LRSNSMTALKQAQGLKSFPPEGGGFYQKGDYKLTNELPLRLEVAACKG